MENRILRDYLDDIGWSPQFESIEGEYEWKHAALVWMKEATARIERLEYQLRNTSQYAESLEARLIEKEVL